MTIKQATTADIDRIMQLITEVVPLMNAAGNWQWDSQYPNPSVFEQDIAAQQLWLAEIDHQLAGIAAINTAQDSAYAQVGWDLTETAIVTHRLAVHPAHQGKGVAAALMAKAEEIAFVKEIFLLRIDTNSMNTATQRLFPKLGYGYAGEIALAFRPGLKFYCYEKRLHRKQ